MALIKLADNKFHDVNEKDIYGNWYCTENDNGTLTLEGDDDTTKLPTNIPLGSKAITTATDVYSFNENGWEAM